MRRLVRILLLMGFILVFNGCASVIPTENSLFQQETGINLTYVMRGLYSTQSTYKNRMIESYYKSFLNKSLVFSVDDSKDEFAQQRITDNTIYITINGQFQDYTNFEKNVLLVASTSALALLRDPNYTRNEISKNFFKIIEDYDAIYKISGIINAPWYKTRNLLITDDSIFIGAKREPIIQ